MKVIDSFNSEYRWLSNFWPCLIDLDDEIYFSVENAYQAAKFGKGERDFFYSCTPGEAKRYARKADLPGDWDKRKTLVMLRLLRQKFSYGSTLGNRLALTGDAELIEGNNWNDVFWGVCGGKGQNMLGKLLMQVRGELQEQKRKQHGQV